MSDLNTEIKIGADASGVEAGVGKAKRSLKDLGDAAQKAGKDAGAGMASVGAGGDKAAGQVDRATKAIIGSVQRATAAIEAGERGTAKYYETLAGQRNVNVNALKPYLDQLKDAERAQQVASGSLDKMGISAKQTAAALRGVPAQFTDIVTSLQGGQAPLTVFLQQGGQLKDMFGGAGNAARALGGYVSGLVNPFTLAAAAGVAIAVAYNQGSKETDAYRLALVSTGNAAGTTANQLQDYARNIASVSGTQGQAAESLAAFAATGKVGANVLREAAQAAVAWEKATGTAISSTAKEFADLAKEPLSAVLKLNEGTNFLTRSVYEQIKSLDEQGRTAEAAAVAQRAYADALTGRSAQITQNLGYIEAAWEGVTGQAKQAWDAMLNVGRSSTPGDAMADLRARLSKQQTELAQKKAINPFADTSGLDRGIEVLKQRIGLLETDERQTRRNAEAERERGEAVKAAADFDKAGQKYLSEQARMERELTVARTLGAAAGKSQAEIEKRLGEIRASYAKKGGSNGAEREANRELERQAKLIAELNGLTGSFAKEWDTLSAVYKKGEMSLEQLTSAQAALLAKQPAIKAFADEQNKAQQALAKANLDAAASREKYITSLATGLDKIKADITAQIEATERMGLSKEAIAELDAAKLEMLATDLELQAIKAMDRNLDQQTYDALKAQAAAYRELGIAKKGGAAKEAALDLEKANAEAAKKAQEDWERASEQINSTLTDALMRGFESGKDFAKNLRDTVVNMFKTMVLRPVVSAIVNPISQGITGMMGLSGAANAGQSALSTIGTGASIFNAGSALGGLGAVGGAMSGFATAATASVQSLLGMSGTVAQMTTSLAAAGHTAAAGVSAGVQAFQAIPGWGWAIAGTAALAAIFSKKSTPHTGGIGAYSAASGATTGSSVGLAFGIDQKHYNQAGEDLSTNVAKSIVGILDATATTFGKQAGYYAATAFADDSSKDGAWGALRIKFGEKVLLDWADTAVRDANVPREFADGEAGSKEYLAEVAKSTRDALVTAIGDVDWATDMLKGLGDTVSLESLAQTVQQINAAKAAFVGFGQYMPAFASLADSAVSKIVQASGGVGALAGNMGAFVDGFYRDSEKLAINTQNVTDALAALGFEMPTTRDEFKALVQSQIALGDAGAQTTAGLLAVSGAVSAVLPPFEDAAAGVGAAIDTVSDAMRRLQSDTASLQIDLLRAQGNTTGADAAQRTLDTTGLSDAEIAIYDYNQSLRAQIGALNDAAQATADQAAIRADFERQLLQLQGDTAALRLLDIAGMDAANVALYDRVQALTASQAAEQAAAAAAQQQASTRAGFERQLQQLQGDTAALRLLDIAGMDAANVALYDRVQALTAEKQAEQEAAQAAQQQAGIRAGFERQLLQLAGDTAALRLLDITGMDAANVALYDRVQALTASQAAEQAASDKAKQVALERYGIETQLLQLQGNTAALRSRELAALEPANRADQLRVYALTDALAATQAAADAERDLAATRVQSAQDAYRAAQESTGSAFDAISRSVGAERAIYESARTAAADAAQEIKSVIDTLTGSIKDLYAGVDSTRQASAVEGASFITAALRAARSTGYLPDAAGLSDAITAARGGLGAQNFATQFEADRAQLVIAGQLSELSDIAKPQLTAAERTLRNAENQLKTLDDILKNAQSQVDAVRGISTTVGTIPAALAGLQSALLSEAQAKALAQSTTAPSATAPAAAPKASGLSGPYAAMVESALKSAAYTTDDRLVYDTARMFNVTSSELDKLMGWTAGTSLDWAKKNKLPEFAVGTNYVPQDMAAIVHKGEMIVPAAYNPATSGAASNNAEVVAELRALRNQNERMEARLASIEGSNTIMANLLDEVTEGGNAMRSEVMA